MKEIVLDTSTLILLAKLDLLELLTKEVKCVIPQAVEAEATVKKELLDAKLIHRLIEERGIGVFKETPLSPLELLETDFRLGKGEAEAIWLAKNKKVLLGIDDGVGIKVCKVLGIRFVTALTFIVRFYEKEIFTKGQTIAKIEKLGKYGWYSKPLLLKVMDEIEREGSK
jgi:predicted nucleic acid-binding protein